MSTTPDVPDPELVLETPRLVLRRPIRADAVRMATLANDATVAENLSILPHPYGLEDAFAYIDNVEINLSRINLGIYLAGEADGGFIGTVSLMPRDGERFVVGYWIGRPYWGKGYATEAVQAIVDLAFGRLEVDAVAATTRVTNGASRQVLEKCGFQFAGSGMGPSLYHRGMVPIDKFRMERSIWTSLKTWASQHATARSA
jgi:RimJ/RimL family protein N-acetyltransferase